MALAQPPNKPILRKKDLGNVCFKFKTCMKHKVNREKELTYTGYYENESIKEKVFALCKLREKSCDRLYHDKNDVSWSTIPWCEACRGTIEIKNHITKGYDLRTIE